MSKLASVIMFCTFLLVSCVKDEEAAAIFVDESLQMYFTAFENEALIRGLAIDLNGARIEGILSDLPGNISGRCQYNSDRPRQVQIDRSYFHSASNLRREFIVFHELGHCYLNRPHLDNQDSNGICISIMHGSSALCQNAYSIATRENYLNELFE